MLLMAVVLMLPYALPRLTLVEDPSRPYWVFMLIYSFNITVPLLAFFRWVPPKTIRKKCQDFGIVPWKLNDVWAGIGYGAIVIMLWCLLDLALLKPLGLTLPHPSYHSSFAQNPFDFGFLAMETFLWVLFNEIVFRGYVFSRVNLRIRSRFLIAISMIGLCALCDTVLYSNSFSWGGLIVSTASTLIYIRSRRLVRSIACNYFFYIVIYTMALWGP
jgi:hypothetical protein